MASQNKGIGFDPEEKGAPQGQNYLLVIAIDEYAHCPKLYNCVKDAKNFIEVLTDKYQFKQDNILTLFNDEATRPNIYTQFKALKRQVGPDDSLLVYFSGHGETGDNVGYWVPVNAQSQREWEYFSTDEIKRCLDAINSFHTFVIVDACFSGSLFTTYKSGSPGYANKRSRWGLAASHSRERALDGTPGENSPFATTLLKQLRDSQNNLPIHNLASIIIQWVMEATDGRQTPVFKPLNVKGDDSGQYVFQLKANEPAAWKTCQAKDTLAAYQTFLAKYRNSAHAEQAKEQIFLKEEQAWEKIRKKNTIAAYIQYRRDLPAGRYREQALEMIQELEEEQSWQQAGRRNTVFSYENYLERYPNGRYRKEAETGMQAILGKAPIGRKPEALQPKPEPQHQNVPIHPNKDKQEPKRRPLRRYLPYLISLFLFTLTAIWIIPQVFKPLIVDSAALMPFKSAENDLYGYMIKDSTAIIAPRFDFAFPFSEGRAVVKKESLYGYINPEGKLVTDFKYQQAEAFSNGLAVVGNNQKFGYIDTSGQVPIKLAYSKADSFNEKGEASVEMNGASMTINKEGKCIRDCPEQEKPEADHKAWIDALEENTKATFLAYQQQFPQGEYFDKAAEKIKGFEEAEKALKAARNDGQAWQAAVKQNSIAAYKQYLQKYSKGKYYKEADARIKQLEEKERQVREEQAWTTAKGNNSISSYNRYLRDYPTGQYYQQAQKRIEALNSQQQQVEASRKEERAWEAARKKDDIAAYETYQKSYPTGQYYQQTQKRIEALNSQQQQAEATRREERAWEDAKNKKDIAAYKSYQAAYPKGKYYDDAGKKIRELEDAAKQPAIRTIRLNGLTWTAQNLNIDVPGSWCYEGKSANCQKYGRLYTWQAAQNACKKLGSRWHLPTDAEWKELGRSFGGYYDVHSGENVGDPEKSYKALLEDGSSGFAALLGGYRGDADGSFNSLGVMGMYWSGTEKNNPSLPSAWYYDFRSSYGELKRSDINTSVGLSCRCLKD